MFASFKALSIYVYPLECGILEIALFKLAALRKAPENLLNRSGTEALVLYSTTAICVPFSDMSKPSNISWMNLISFLKLPRLMLPDVSTIKAKSRGIGQPSVQVKSKTIHEHLRKIIRHSNRNLYG